MDEIFQTVDQRAIEAREAIRKERERRSYEVLVPLPRQIGWIGGRAVPESLSAFAALTQCTVDHGGPRRGPSIPCQWTDVVFFHKARLLRVILQEDLNRPVPGFEHALAIPLMPIEEVATILFRELMEQAEKPEESHDPNA